MLVSYKLWDLGRRSEVTGQKMSPPSRMQWRHSGYSAPRPRADCRWSCRPSSPEKNDLKLFAHCLWNVVVGLFFFYQASLDSFLGRRKEVISLIQLPVINIYYITNILQWFQRFFCAVPWPYITIDIRRTPRYAFPIWEQRRGGEGHEVSTGHTPWETLGACWISWVWHGTCLFWQHLTEPSIPEQCPACHQGGLSFLPTQTHQCLTYQFLQCGYRLPYIHGSL